MNGTHSFLFILQPPSNELREEKYIYSNEKCENSIEIYSRKKNQCILHIFVYAYRAAYKYLIEAHMCIVYTLHICKESIHSEIVMYSNSINQILTTTCRAIQYYFC